MRVWGQVKLNLLTGSSGLHTSIYINNICFFRLEFCPEAVVWLLLWLCLTGLQRGKKERKKEKQLRPPVPLWTAEGLSKSLSLGFGGWKRLSEWCGFNQGLPEATPTLCCFGAWNLRLFRVQPQPSVSLGQSPYLVRSLLCCLFSHFFFFLSLCCSCFSTKGTGSLEVATCLCLLTRCKIFGYSLVCHKHPNPG